jgi:hypothetical protein
VNAVALANFKDCVSQGRLCQDRLALLAAHDLISGEFLVLGCQHAETFLVELSFELLVMAGINKVVRFSPEKEEDLVEASAKRLDHGRYVANAPSIAFAASKADGLDHVFVVRAGGFADNFLIGVGTKKCIGQHADTEVADFHLDPLVGRELDGTLRELGRRFEKR